MISPGFFADALPRCLRALHALFAVTSTLAAAFGPCDAAAAWHDAYPGKGVAVHYVRLTGHGGDNAVNLTNLLTRHRGCVDMMSEVGRPAEPLPTANVPRVVSVHEIEIYYAAQRTLTVKRGTLYDIDPDTCALLAIPHSIAELAWRGGRCDVDMIRNVARGSCDAAPLALSATAPSPRAAAGASGPEIRTFAGMTCQPFRLPLGAEVCVANPGAQTLDPRPILAAPLNAGVPGLLLETRSPALTLRAQEVRLNLSVPSEMFSLPPGVKVIERGSR